MPKSTGEYKVHISTWAHEALKAESLVRRKQMKDTLAEIIRDALSPQASEILRALGWGGPVGEITVKVNLDDKTLQQSLGDARQALGAAEAAITQKEPDAQEAPAPVKKGQTPQDKRDKIKELHAQGCGNRTIARTLGISHSTVARILKE